MSKNNSQGSINTKKRTCSKENFNYLCIYYSVEPDKVYLIFTEKYLSLYDKLRKNYFGYFFNLKLTNNQLVISNVKFILLTIGGFNLRFEFEQKISVYVIFN